MRTQVAALCWRMRKDELQVLLISSRRRKRWIVPKGWPIEGCTPAQSAAIEALEEAGVEGRCSDVCLGIFSYIKQLDEQDLPCVVPVFPLEVKRIHDDWPEKNERQRRWVSIRKALDLIDDAEMRPILRNFRPNKLAG
ncbi:NUDIX hydrolase [Roseitranquillus sediminis]|uniref:NUDIX hydrolase n=1 Tax=Roseitranquillus sediminis TaxID=2809051 RepID=UPI001D0C874F|nr:NUDIX hydrolase [Roseitranquillus sediminis]